MKVLFVGFGSIAQKHYRALKELRPDAMVYALKSGTRDSGNSNIKDLYSWDEVPSDISFAIVSNPTFSHTATILRLSELNIPIFIEKPLSDTLDRLNEIEAVISEKHLMTYVACNLRFLPVLQYLKTQVLPRVSRVQEVSIYCGSFLPDWRPGKDYKEIYSANKDMGGGVHLDLFHELDYNCWLFGIPQKTFSILRNRSSLGISAADFASYQLVYPGHVSMITLNYYRPDPKRTIEIVTNEMTLLVDLLNNSITDSSGNRIFEAKESTISDTYVAQMDYFLRLLEGKEQPFNTFGESLEILKICLSGEETDW